MAIALRSGSPASSTGNGDSNGTSPFIFTTNAVDGDLYIAWFTMVSENPIGALTWPSGWTSLAFQEVQTSSIGNCYFRTEVGYTLWQTGDSTGKSSSLNTNLINGRWTCSTVGYSGVDTTTPIAKNAMGSSDTGASTAAVSTPTVNSGISGVWRVSLFGCFRQSATPSWSNYNPADTERRDSSSPIGTNRVGNAFVDSDSSVNASSGTSVSGTPNGSAYGRVGAILLVNPVGGVEPPAGQDSCGILIG